ncbi:MAG: efflux RND transporter permease subunit, partial [Planctomycetes bacterium]|nr:efflux RND transporter permease subunit [Planctomycetota bacterium]
AAILVILTVYIFLEDWRATLIPAITIPVSLIGTFAVMMMFGMSINTLTLFGLVLAIGIVVDDAIIVVENCSRIIDKEKLSSKEAAIKAMKQITGPVIATTLVLLAVFAGTALIGGISGRLYTQFAITIATATVFSTVNALTLSPALCGLFLRPSFKHRGLIGLFDRFIKRTTTVYMNAVEHIIRHVVVAMVLFAVLVGATWGASKLIPSGFLPNEDEGYFLINVELPPGAGMERTRQVTDQVNRILTETPGIHESVTIGGYSLFTGTISPNAATYFIMLKPWNERKGQGLSVASISQQVQARLFGILDARCLAFTPPPISGLGMASGFEVKIQDRSGLGLTELQKVGDRLVYAGSSNPMFIFVNSDFRADVPQLYLDIDRVKVARLGISLDEVFTTLQANLGTAYVNDLNLFGRTYKVLLQAQDQFRAKAEDILKLEVRNRDGKMIPLRTFVAVSDVAGSQSVFHYNLYPATTISGMAIPIFSSGQAMAEMEKLIKENLPAGMGYEWSGMSYQEIVAGNKAPIIFALASVFVFLFLAAQYESWFIPIAIVLSVPLALFGAMLGTLLRAYDNNIYTQIGIVLLIGLASKTAILLVEFAKQHHEDGHSIEEAAMTAAKLRFRPILMTALTFVLGVVPLVIATGAGAASRRALGTTVFSGMLAATLFGVLMIPVFYVVIQKLADKLSFKKHKPEEMSPRT